MIIILEPFCHNFDVNLIFYSTWVTGPFHPSLQERYSIREKIVGRRLTPSICQTSVQRIVQVVHTGGNLLAWNSEEIGWSGSSFEPRERDRTIAAKTRFRRGTAVAHLALSRPTIDRSNHVRQQAAHAVSNRELKPMRDRDARSIRNSGFLALESFPFLAVQSSRMNIKTIFYAFLATKI